MKCDRATQYVEAFADNELGALRRFAMRRHLAACPGCSARVDETLALQQRIRAEVPRASAPPELRAQVMALRPSPASTQHAAVDRRWRWAAGGALAGSLLTVAAWLAGNAVLDQRARDDVALVAVNAHVAATLSARLTDVASSDQHTVKPWLSARLDYSPPVRDFATAGFPLVGARIDRLDGRPIATLVYRYREHTVDVFVRPHASHPGWPERRTIRGFNVFAAEGSGMDWLVVSDASAESIAPLLRELPR